MIWASRFGRSHLWCDAPSRRAIRSITFAPSASLRSPCRFGGSAAIPLAKTPKQFRLASPSLFKGGGWGVGF